MPLRQLRNVLAAFVIILASASAAFAQKELSWRALDVVARLEADGRLSVVEHHAMVFTGDWNGGERIFRVEPGQRLALGMVRRIDPTTGKATILIAKDLDDVDNFALLNGTQLRWRSRLQSDPEFDHTEIDYEIGYALSGVLLKQGDTYVLDHNFALPDADKTIGSFSVDLALDPVWVVPEDFERHRTAANLPAGANFVVHADLGRVGSAPAASAVRVGTTPLTRAIVFIGLLGGILVIARRFIEREKALGRFGSPIAPDAVTPEWLDEKVFSLLPEEAGALWDDKVGPPEVAAVLARLEADKKIESTTSSGELSMRLTVSRKTLHDYEGILVYALFYGDRTQVSTSEIKAHYKKSGFDPAAKIRPGLLKKISNHLDFGDRAEPPTRQLTLRLIIAGAAFLLWNAVMRATDVGTLLSIAISAGFAWGVGAIGARLYQKRVDGLIGLPLWFLISPAWFLYLSGAGISSGGTYPVSVLIGAVLVRLGVVNSLFNLAMAREGPKKIARRRELAAARRFFARELKMPVPQLKDAWFPWFVAFGLGPRVDRWFRSFGGTVSTGASTATSSFSSGSSASSFSGGGSFTGYGGGRSGGAGASASWAAAVASVAAGVSAPSSSSGGGSSGGSSGGGGGGGGSSGGGGGGGW